MAFVINTNLNANQAQLALNQNLGSLSRTFERLASGTRINGASDDAAGLSISTRMEAQVRGISKAVGNANDAISLSQTADSALNEVTNVLQRIRELTVQAASDINSVEDRQKIQTEIDELVKEIDRIGQSEFNGKALFGGQFDFQLGSNVDQESNLDLTTEKLASNRLGSYARDTTGAVDTTRALLDGELTIIKSDGTSVAVRPTTANDDTISYISQDGTVITEGSAIAKAAAINSGTAYHGVTAQVGSTTFINSSFRNRSVATSLTGGSKLFINGGEISGITVLPEDADGSFIDAINEISEETGVVASIDDDGIIKLFAEDGRNIVTEAYGTAVDWGFGRVGGPAHILVEGGTLTLESRDQYTLKAVGGIDALGGIGPGETPSANITQLETGKVKQNRFTPGTDTGWDAAKDVISITGYVPDNSLLEDKYFHVIFNNQRVQLKIPTYNGGNLGQPYASTNWDGEDSSIELTSFSGSSSNLTIQIDNLENIDSSRSGDQTVDAFRFQLTSVGDINYPVKALMSRNFDETTVSSIDVSNTEFAELALKTVDIALEEVNATRSKLGAMNNYLESTISNLEQTKNNVAGAKSKIMDADFAAETAQLSKSQIIQQAGISVLSQANSIQQAVLDLL